MSAAYILDFATIGANCYICHNIVIEDNVIIEDGFIMEAGTFIDYGVIIENNAFIYSNVSICYSIIGDDIVILPGARIGQVGFGFSTEKGIHYKIFHTGLVRIGNKIEIGSNTTIDRGTEQDIIIEDLCRIDNLVQIAHNVVIRKGSIIVSQVDISWSIQVGTYCVLGGQVGLVGHITIGDKSQVAALSGVIKNVKSRFIIGGSPAIPIKEWIRQSLIFKQMANKRANNEN